MKALQKKSASRISAQPPHFDGSFICECCIEPDTVLQIYTLKPLSFSKDPSKVQILLNTPQQCHSEANNKSIARTYCWIKQLAVDPGDKDDSKWKACKMWKTLCVCPSQKKTVLLLSTDREEAGQSEAIEHFWSWICAVSTIMYVWNIWNAFKLVCVHLDVHEE